MTRQDSRDVLFVSSLSTTTIEIDHLCPWTHPPIVHRSSCIVHHDNFTDSDAAHQPKMHYRRISIATGESTLLPISRWNQAIESGDEITSETSWGTFYAHGHDCNHSLITHSHHCSCRRPPHVRIFEEVMPIDVNRRTVRMTLTTPPDLPW